MTQMAIKIACPILSSSPDTPKSIKLKAKDFLGTYFLMFTRTGSELVAFKGKVMQL